MSVEFLMDAGSARYTVVFVTTGSEEEAAGIGGQLVNEGLAACVNVLPGLVSIFTWKGAVEQDKECLMIIKSRVELLDKLIQRIKALHSYDVPEVIALPIIGGNRSYLDWIDDVTG